MYDYQSQTSLPPIRARQQRQSGVQVQQLYESSPVLAALSHHPTTQYTSHKAQHGDSSTLVNGNSTTVTNNNGTGIFGETTYTYKDELRQDEIVLVDSADNYSFGHPVFFQQKRRWLGR